MGRGAAGRIGHRLAIDIAECLQRRVGRHIPEQIAGPGHAVGQRAYRRSFGKGREGARRSDAQSQVYAVGDHRLQRFSATLGVQDLQFQAVFLEDAEPLADLWRRILPGAPLADRQGLAAVGIDDPRVAGS